MNVKTAIFSTTIAIIAASSAIQSADAQGARFKYAPNVYKIEESRLPAGYGQPAAAAHNPHSVTHGSMPKGNSLLGIDPTMLAARPKPAPRVAPIAQTQLSGIPSFTNVVPMLNPFAPVANKGQFGQPLNVPPVVASLPPQAAKPQTSKPPAPAASSNVSGKLRTPARANTAVAGRMVKPRALAAKQGPAIQSYGNNNFYSVGSTAPTGGGTSTSTSVNGRILFKSTQH